MPRLAGGALSTRLGGAGGAGRGGGGKGLLHRCPPTLARVPTAHRAFAQIQSFSQPHRNPIGGS